MAEVAAVELATQLVAEETALDVWLWVRAMVRAPVLGYAIVRTRAGPAPKVALGKPSRLTVEELLWPNTPAAVAMTIDEAVRQRRALKLHSPQALAEPPH